jgi:hypothetical protein
VTVPVIDTYLKVKISVRLELIRHYASRGNLRGGHAKRFFSSSWDGQKKMDVVGGVERMYDARQFPVPRYPQQPFLRDIQKGERPWISPLFQAGNLQT